MSTEQIDLEKINKIREFCRWYKENMFGTISFQIDFISFQNGDNEVVNYTLHAQDLSHLSTSDIDHIMASIEIHKAIGESKLKLKSLRQE